MVKSLWARWKRFAQKVGDFQARVLLTLIYFLILGPFGLVVSVLRDPLKVKRGSETATWVPREAERVSLENAMRQF
jgi:hypothetical protein